MSERAKTEMLYHTLLIYKKAVKVGSVPGDRALRALLAEHGSFQGIYDHFFETDSDTKRNARLVKSIDSLDCDILTVNDPDFPDTLKKDGATPVIYYRGDKELLKKKSIAVVGTRELEDIVDIEAGESIVKRLVDKDYCVVSGLARGCDTLAHQRALDYGGSTIAVLGTPLSSHYPKENWRLQERIAIEQLLISQYPIGIKTFPSYFAHRNLTTVSLASDGVVVIRAGDSSGTMHAVMHCIAQKKQLYVLKNNFVKGYRWVEDYIDKIKVPNGDLR